MQQCLACTECAMCLQTTGVLHAELAAGALAGYFLKNRQLSNSKASLIEILALSSFNLFLGLIPNSSVDNAGTVFCPQR